MKVATFVDSPANVIKSIRNLQRKYTHRMPHAQHYTKGEPKNTGSQRTEKGKGEGTRFVK